MQLNRIQTLAGSFALMAAFTVTSPTPAIAYDPCQRASAAAHEAEERFWRWCDNNKDRWGSCSVEGRGVRLYNEMMRTMEVRQRECS